MNRTAHYITSVGLMMVTTLQLMVEQLKVLKSAVSAG
jgi:hypothetical protein